MTAMRPDAHAHAHAHGYRPIGYFVHHQGRGHAERCAALVNALPDNQPVTVFCAKPAIFPEFTRPVEMVEIPSLFEPTGSEDIADTCTAPETVHCAPLGWPGIRTAMAILAQWFRTANPVLMISDVSAEIAQLARLCSVPHVMVLQHGQRGDPGHRAAYDGAAGILCAADAGLAQPDWPAALRRKTHFAGGLGVDVQRPDRHRRQAARRKLGLTEATPMVLVMSGGGGSGFASAPIAVGARAHPDQQWITIGRIDRDWHATEPANLRHDGWVDNAADYLAAADLVVASTGNTTCHQILGAERPWLAIPEWRYFDEQIEKAKVLHAVGAACHAHHFPSSPAAWRTAIQTTLETHAPDTQRRLVSTDAARTAAAWLLNLTSQLDPTRPFPIQEDLSMQPSNTPSERPENTPVAASVLTLARGRKEHLVNVIHGLNRQKQKPVELVIGYMQEAAYRDLPETDFPIHQIHIAGTELPLARARNTVAKAATCDVLIFLDVDCIPAPTFVADYARQVKPGQGLLMGEVMYLPAGAAGSDWSYDGFDKVAQRHSDRAGPPDTPTKVCKDYRCFWSLNFAIHRDDWDRTGGFDEDFVGYGGEDTDFGRRVDDCGIAIQWMRGAKVFHQHHTHFMPPVHHIPAILRNTEVFAAKWGHRTMEHWISAFVLMGLVENRNGKLVQVREPDDSDLDMCRQTDDMPFASSSEVMRLLQARTAVAAE